MSDGLRPVHAELLGRADLFAGLDPVTLARLAGCAGSLSLEGGAAVCRQDDPADGLYIVVQGTFGVFAAPGDGAPESRLGVLAPGDYFGEMALLEGEPRSATVRADGPGEVLQLEQARFVELLRREPTVALAVAAPLSRRLRAAGRTVVEDERLVARGVEASLARLPPERRLAGARCWDEALAILARYGPRSAFLATLVRAIRDEEGMSALCQLRYGGPSADRQGGGQGSCPDGRRRACRRAQWKS